MPVSGESTAIGAERYEVDCFATPNAEMVFQYIQTKLDCPLRPQAGATGQVNLVEITGDPDGDGCVGREGGATPISLCFGIVAQDFDECLVAVIVPIGVPQIHLLPKAPYYLFTATYEADECNDSDFLGYIQPGTASDPPLANDPTRMREWGGPLVPLDLVDTMVAVEPNTCCFGGQTYGDIEPAVAQPGGGTHFGDCDVDVDDILCAIFAFRGVQGSPNCDISPNGPADVWPCSVDGRHGNGVLDVDDVLSVVDAFSGNVLDPACVAPCPGCNR